MERNGEKLKRDRSSRKGSDIGQDRDNVKCRLVLGQRGPKPKHSLQGLGDKWMLPQGNARDSNMKTGDDRSVISHSAILGPFLIYVSYVLDYNGRSSSERVSLELLTKVPKPFERISVSRCG